MAPTSTSTLVRRRHGAKTCSASNVPGVIDTSVLTEFGEPFHCCRVCSTLN